MTISSSLPNDVLTNIPGGLPVPEDDGRCNHLLGASIPSIELISSQGGTVDLAKQQGWVVVYCYPMTGTPGRAIPDGWAEIPGAAGCTPQSCAFRDSDDAYRTIGARVYGISTQTPEDQLEAATRLKLPYALLSDHALQFATALALPTFDVVDMRLLKRMSFIVKDGKIVHYVYPVFPPNQNARDMLAWLHQHAGQYAS